MSDNLRIKLRSVEDDLAQLRRERADKIKARDAARDAFAAAPGYDTNSDEYKAAHQAVKAVGEVDERIAQAQEAQVGILRMLGQEQSTAHEVLRETAKAQEDNRSDARRLVDGEAFKSLAPYANSKGRFGSVDLGSVSADFALKADVGVSAGARRGNSAGIPAPLYRPLSVLDLVSTGQTNGNAVPYVQFGPAASAAAVQTEGQPKAQADANFTDAQADIDTIAAFYKVRKQTLADARAIQAILEGQLRFDVRAALEAAVIAEILGTPGIGNTPNAAEPVADLISHSMLDILLANLQADAVVLHPRDWERIRLAKDDNGQYQFGPPSQAGATTIFGIPAVPSVAVAEGAPLVGAFRAGATVFIRDDMTVLVSDSDADDFTRNRVTILGELRAGTAVWRPAAFSTADLTP